MLRSGTSALALCALAAAAPAYGQTVPPEDPTPGEQEPQGQTSTDADLPDSLSGSTQVEESTSEVEEGTTDGRTIIVTGIRQSLANSQNIKKNADTFVDAITAEDIGALPDRSVTEALQRIPGVSINRFAGSSDPDHFSVEGSGVVVRGLSFVRSEFNGRDTFSTGVYGQAINFADVPADLLGSVEVYKNSTAEMIEGGLSGTVNMNLRVPFDNKGFHVGANIEATYSDFAKKWSPVGSVLVSNTWDTGIGRIGLLGAFSYSQLFSRSDGLHVTNFQTRDGGTAQQAFSTNIICRNRLPSNTDTMTLPPPGSPCGTAETAGADGFADLMPLAYAPVGGQFRTQDFNRERTGMAGAAQWESLDRRTLVTASFLRSEARQQWGEHTFEAGPDLSEYNTYPVGCRPNASGPGGSARAQCPVGGFENYEYDEDMVFERGYITLPVGGWRGSPFAAGWGGQAVGDRVPHGGMQHSLARRQVDDTNIVQDHGLNLKFTPNDRWAFNFDAQYVRAKHTNLDVSVFGSLFADQELDLTGRYPVVTPHKPGQLGFWSTWSGSLPASPELEAASDEEYFSNPRYTFWRAAMDHAEDSRGKEWAFRGDAAYRFNPDSFLTRLKFGARYADRDQHIRFTTYNWGSLSEVWSGRAVHMDEVGGSNIEQYDWNNFFRGQTNRPPTANYYAGDLIGDYRGAINFFRSIQDAARAAGGGSATSWNPLAGRPGVVPGTMYLPSEIQDVSDMNKAAYAMLSFDDDYRTFGGVRIEGNIGVRYVDTRVDSVGSIGVPSQSALGIEDPFSVRCAPTVPPGAPPGTPPSSPGGVCLIGLDAYAELQAWATGITEPDVATNKYDYFLPSLNLKLGLSETLIMRFAASRNLARPAMANIRNFLTVGSDSSSGFRL
ncbi:MAG TPA: TonB-dependent receptor, partial [Sphingomicrobium sp.]|nr:TonB-dependent receptor [Sphingomicrobium sp.]